MELFLMIMAAVVVAAIIAFLIVKFLPLKLRWLPSLVLLALSIFLVYKIYEGIMGPIKFNQEKKVRYAKVIKSLKLIRDAEGAYYKVTGNYTDKQQDLIQFIDTAKFAITESRDTVIKVNVGGGIVNEVSKRKIDTIGYRPVLEDFTGKDYKNMFNVPGVAGKQFELAIGSVEKVAGLKVPVFRARVDKESILKGLDASLIKIEKEAVTSNEIKGEYVSVGSLEEVTDGGNWPPSYDDKKDRAKEDDK